MFPSILRWKHCRNAEMARNSNLYLLVPETREEVTTEGGLDGWFV